MMKLENHHLMTIAITTAADSDKNHKWTPRLMGTSLMSNRVFTSFQRVFPQNKLQCRNLGDTNLGKRSKLMSPVNGTN